VVAGLYYATCKETGTVRTVQLIERTNYGYPPTQTLKLNPNPKH
jgi:hypothetical protein